MICDAQPATACAAKLSAPKGCTLAPPCRRTPTRTRRSRRNKKCAGLGCNGGWMMTTPPPSKMAPKTTAKKPATGKRRLARQPDNYPQSGAPLPEPIEGAEIVLRVAGMFQRGMTLAQITELARGISWACGAVGMFAAIQPHVPGETIDALAIEARASFEDGQAQVSEARIKSAAKKEQAA